MDGKNEILLSCLRSPTGDPPHRPAADWRGLGKRSNAHHVGPLVYHWIRSTGAAASVPAPALRVLRNAYLRTSARNTLLYHQLGDLLRALRTDGIAVMPLKGAHLAESVYGNVALRPMADIDLLIRQADLPRVEATMWKLGYRVSGGRDWYVNAHYHVAFLPPGKGPLAEIHWHVVRPDAPFRIDMDGIWRRARLATVAGVEVSVLSPEDLILYLCIHTAYLHGFRSGLLSFCDIAKTLARCESEIDWDILARLADEWGGRRCAALALYLTRNWLLAPVPESVLGELCSGEDFENRAAFAAKLVLEHQPMSRDLAMLWGSKGLREKGAAVWKNVFLPRDVLANYYPAGADSRCIYLYYPVHLWNLVRKYGGDVWRLLRGNPEMHARVRCENAADALREWMGLS